MSRRYGRNQRRAHRQRIAELELILEKRETALVVALASRAQAIDRAAKARTERDAAVRSAMLLDDRVLREMPAGAIAAGELELQTAISGGLRQTSDGFDVACGGRQEISGSLRLLYATPGLERLAWSDDSPFLALETSTASLIVWCEVTQGNSPRIHGSGHGLTLGVRALRTKSQPDPWAAAAAMQMSMAAGRMVWVRAAVGNEG